MRFTKSSTDRPDEKRAERAVGSTWFGAADIVADDFRRVAAEEDRAGIADPRRAAPPASATASSRCSGAIRLASAQRRRRATCDHDDRAEVAPARRRGLGARQRLQLALDRRPRPRSAKARVVGDQDRLRRRRRARPAPAGRRRSSPDRCRASAMTSTSDGPAIMSMPTVPNTCRLAAAT